MNKPISKINPTSHKTVIFWTIIAAITMFFVGLVIYRFVDRQKEVKDLNELTNLREQQIFEQGGTYYVYVYSIAGVTKDQYELEKAENLKEQLLMYLSYVKRNSDANKMYGMIVDSSAGNYGNHSCLVSGSDATTSVNGKSSFSNLRIHENDIPILLKISNGTVESSFLTETAILNELKSAIK